MKISSLPAGSGDCFVITWGNPARALIIDGGRAGCYNKYLRGHLAQLANDGLSQVELVLVTHIDEDHMEGLIKWVETYGESPLPIQDFWFNGRPQLPRDGLQIESVNQGEALSDLLENTKVAPPWNKFFDGKAAMVETGGEFHVVSFPDAMRLTLLAPGPVEMRELASRWNKEVAGENVMLELMALAEGKKKPPAPMPLKVDEWADIQWQHSNVGPTNLSSITCLLEHEGKTALFTGDADPNVVVAAWTRLVAERGEIKLDLLKLNHHGSHNNCSPELIKTLRPKKVLVSSDGSIYGHPEKEALSYAIANSPGVELIFNYDNEYSRPWTDSAEQKRWKYSARAGGATGVIVEL